MWSTIIEGEGPEQSLSHRFAVSGEPGKRGGGLEERGVEEEKRGGGGDPSIRSPLGNYRLSRRPKSQRLNKEMKRNLRKMDEPPGKHPLFIPLVLQMITNALSPSRSLSALKHTHTHTQKLVMHTHVHTKRPFTRKETDVRKKKKKKKPHPFERPRQRADRISA